MKSITTIGQKTIQECRNRMSGYSEEKREQLKAVSKEICDWMGDAKDRIQNKVDSLPKVTLKQALEQVRKKL